MDKERDWHCRHCGYICEEHKAFWHLERGCIAHAEKLARQMNEERDSNTND